MKKSTAASPDDLRFSYFTLEKAPDAVFWIDDQAKIQRVNEAACRHLGYSRSELTALTVFDIDPNYRAENWRHIIEKVKREGVLTFETRHRTRSGRIIPVEIISNYIEFEGEDYFCAFARDISRRKAAERTLRENEERLRAIGQALPDLVFVLDEDGRHLDVMTSQENLLYQSVHEIRGKLLDQIFPELLAGQFLALVRKTVESGKTGKIEYELPIGDEKRCFEARTAPLNFETGGKRCIVWIARDITDRKQAETALEESEERLREIGNALPDLVFLVDEDGYYLEVLTHESNLLYVDREKLKGQRIPDLFPKPTSALFWGAIQRTIRTGQSELIEYELPVPAGNRWFEGRTARLNMAIGGKRCMVFIARDITDRKQVQLALRESEERYRHLYNHTPVMMKATDLENRIIDANDYYIHTLGYTREEILGRPSVDFLTEDSRRYVLEHVAPRVFNREFVRQVEVQIVKKSGELIDAELSTGADVDENGNIRYVLSFFTDITDRKRAEALQSEKLYLQEVLKSELNFGEIVGSSAAMQAVFKSIEMVAATDATVLLLGETGTGKELIARAIHNRSNQKDAVLVKVNCGALPQGLAESELFGHEKGAFTGATARKKGRFELAHNGTIFLDEVGELPPETQIKLLRILQEREFERVGGEETLQINVRVIAATNRDLEAEVKKGNFRADLFYRLNIFPIRVPPLRERKDDVPLLANHFAKTFAERMGKRLERIHAGALEKLMKSDWPGNVRELANILERAVILCQGTVLQQQHIFGLEEGPVEAGDFPTLEEMERRHILKALEKTGGVLAGPRGAAKLLNMHRSTLWARMQKLGINASGEG